MKERKGEGGEGEGEGRKERRGAKRERESGGETRLGVERDVGRGAGQ